jgi:hypothetical protein
VSKKGVKKGSQQALSYTAKQQSLRQAQDITLFQDGIQTAIDITMIVLNQEFGLGCERLKRFNEEFSLMFSDVMQKRREDKDDSDRWYSEQKFEEALKRACGPYYVEKKVRYAEDG